MSLSKILRAMYLVSFLLDCCRIAGTRCHASGCSWNWARSVSACFCCCGHGPEMGEDDGQHKILLPRGSHSCLPAVSDTHVSASAHVHQPDDSVEGFDVEIPAKVEDSLKV
jgi:hypothetical protein